MAKVGQFLVAIDSSFGFHSASSLIALIHICCGGLTLSPVHR